MAKQDYPSEEDFLAAAWLLKCDVRAIKAVAKVESGPYGAFLDNEEGEAPVILYERHYFYRLTGKDLSPFKDARLPGVAEQYSWLCKRASGGYGPVSIQHKKLQAAIDLRDPTYSTHGIRYAALQSCSWGLFQIMGANYKRAGYDDLQRFINAMYRSVQDHLRAFTMFIRSDHRLVDALRGKDWQKFETYYNGSKAGGVYAKKIAKEFGKL